MSTHTPGKRLSAFFDKPGPRRGLNPAFVTGIVTQIIQALTVLQSKGDDVTHSAITPDRVVVTTGGRICVVEHVLGLALRQLNLSASQLWREFGLISAPTPNGAVNWTQDRRLPARRAGAGDVARPSAVTAGSQGSAADLLDQWSDAATRAGLASDRLRVWLERALQLGNRTYSTAADAYSDLRDMPSESPASAFDSLPMGDVEPFGKRSLQPARQAAGQDSLMANAPAPDDFPVEHADPPTSEPALVPTEPLWTDLRRKRRLSPPHPDCESRFRWHRSQLRACRRRRAGRTMPAAPPHSRVAPMPGRSRRRRGAAGCGWR